MVPNSDAKTKMIFIILITEDKFLFDELLIILTDRYRNDCSTLFARGKIEVARVQKLHQNINDIFLRKIINFQVFKTRNMFCSILNFPKKWN